MFSESKKRIRFVTGNFTSPILGNVWTGRIAVIGKKTAQRFIDLGQAEEIDDDGKIIQAAAQINTEQEPISNRESVTIVKAPEKAAKPAPEDAGDGEDDGAAGDQDAGGEAAAGEDAGTEEPPAEPAQKVVAAEGHSPKPKKKKKK